MKIQDEACEESEDAGNFRAREGMTLKFSLSEFKEFHELKVSVSQPIIFESAEDIA